MTEPNRGIRTELERHLASPEGFPLRDAYLVRLHILAARIHTYLSAGVSPPEYATGRALAQAVDAAVTILETYPMTETPERHTLPSRPLSASLPPATR